MQDLKMDGVTSCNGGTYGDAHITGVNKIHGDLTCNSLHIEGVSTIVGQLTTGPAHLAGTCKVSGSVKTEDFSFYGVVTVNGDMQCETLTAEGALDVSGALNAEDIRLVMSHSSQVREVYGHSFSLICIHGSVWLSLLRARRQGFTSELVECDEVSVEHSQIKTLRGARVRVGPKCRIELLEYSESLDVDKTSVVDKIVRVGVDT